MPANFVGFRHSSKYRVMANEECPSFLLLVDALQLSEVISYSLFTVTLRCCRYGVGLVCKKQPLLRGRGVSHCKNLLSPRFETSDGISFSLRPIFALFQHSVQVLCQQDSRLSLVFVELLQLNRNTRKSIVKGFT